jgi:hypothetical protein
MLHNYFIVTLDVKNKMKLIQPQIKEKKLFTFQKTFSLDFAK